MGFSEVKEGRGKDHDNAEGLQAAFQGLGETAFYQREAACPLVQADNWNLQDPKVLKEKS